MWQASLRQASFRGVPFGVFDVEKEGGRRVVLHEVPLLDDTWVEDLGASPQKFSINAFVLGADYLVKAKALMAALEEAGAGTLVHPYFGELSVCLASPYKCKQSAQDGGMAVFNFAFVRSQNPQNPSPTLNHQRISLEKISELRQACLAYFAPYAEQYKNSERTIRALEQELGTMLSQVTGIALQVSGLGDVATPALGGAIWQKTLEAESSTAQSIAGQGSNRLDLAIKIKPQNPAQKLVQQALVIEGIGALVKSPLESRKQATSHRQKILNGVASVQNQAGLPDALFALLVDLRSASITTLSKLAGTAPEVASITPTACLPSLVLAHRHSKVSLELDLIERNGVKNPCFVSPDSLEVLIG